MASLLGKGSTGVKKGSSILAMAARHGSSRPKGEMPMDVGSDRKSVRIEPILNGFKVTLEGSYPHKEAHGKNYKEACKIGEAYLVGEVPAAKPGFKDTSEKSENEE